MNIVFTLYKLNKYLLQIPQDDSDICKKEGIEAPIRNPDIALDINIIISGLQECLKEDSLLMDGYLRAYTELTKFFGGLGSGFGFITTHVNSRIDILKSYRKGDKAEYYYSIQSMLQHEKKEPSPTHPSAARILYNLNRTLPFCIEMLKAVVNADTETNLGPLAQTVYKEKLSQYHSWIIAKMINAVLLLLPNKKNFVLKVS